MFAVLSQKEFYVESIIQMFTLMATKTTYTVYFTYFDSEKVYCLVLSPCGNYLFSTDFNCLKIWNIQNRKCLTTIKKDSVLGASHCIFSPSGKYFVMGSTVWKTDKRYWIKDVKVKYSDFFVVMIRNQQRAKQKKQK